jgi:hypothetical protein
MNLCLASEQDRCERPLIEASWTTDVDLAGVSTTDSYVVRIPPSDLMVSTAQNCAADGWTAPRCSSAER